MMLLGKIITDFVYPPIPLRGFDWCAFYDGEEEAGDYGWGETEEKAVNDLIAKTEGEA